MRPSHKLHLISAIAAELQQRYSFNDIDAYLQECGIETPHQFCDSKAAYVKHTLYGIDNSVVTRIIEDLEINVAGLNLPTPPPKNWIDSRTFRLFISHLALEKDKATRLRGTLAPYHISALVAHQDIYPTAQWQVEIERALSTMEAFLAIHTKGFSASMWAQQEVGFAVARRVKIISLKMGEDPTGFISKHQALSRLNRTAEEIAKEVNTILLSDELTSRRSTI
ncbi:MAG TPA: toll/interleukin-1 receptor domain-containing protein [Roseiarcus sp.]|nr:toll/interleukin-1 receptor domain-containing protein [Roseiarcus sp.]